MKKITSLVEALTNETIQKVITWNEIDTTGTNSEFSVKIGHNTIIIKRYLDTVEELSKIVLWVIDKHGRELTNIEKSHVQTEYSSLDTLYNHALSSARDADAAIDSIFLDLQKIKNGSKRQTF